MKTHRLIYILPILLLLYTASCTRAVIKPTDDGVDPTTLGQVKFDPDIQQIIWNNCLTCHAGPAPSANLRLDSYTLVRSAAENNNLLGRINSTSAPMPPAGLLNDHSRAQIEKWILDGYPEN